MRLIQNKYHQQVIKNLYKHKYFTHPNAVDNLVLRASQMFGTSYRDATNLRDLIIDVIELLAEVDRERLVT